MNTAYTFLRQSFVVSLFIYRNKPTGLVLIMSRLFSMEREMTNLEGRVRHLLRSLPYKLKCDDLKDHSLSLKETTLTPQFYS